MILTDAQVKLTTDNKYCFYLILSTAGQIQRISVSLTRNQSRYMTSYKKGYVAIYWQSTIRKSRNVRM